MLNVLLQTWTIETVTHNAGDLNNSCLPGASGSAYIFDSSRHIIWEEPLLVHALLHYMQTVFIAGGSICECYTGTK